MRIKVTTQNSSEYFIANPGFQPLGKSNAIHKNRKSSLSLSLENCSSKESLENCSCKHFVDPNPRYWLNKLNYSMELHEAWSSLIEKVEKKNSDLKENIVTNLKKMIQNQHHGAELFPLTMFSKFGDMSMVKFIIENHMVDRYV